MLMEGFPPRPGATVSAANWREPPFNRWGFWHTRELLPTQRVWRGGGAVSPFPPRSGAINLSAIPLTVSPGSESAQSVGEVLEKSFTDAWVVLQDGQLVEEWYAEGGGPGVPHAVMSVTKSLVGAVCAVLIDQGALAPQDLATAYVPELQHTAWEGVTVRDLLDMRSGVQFVEDYTDPQADVRRLDDWIAWRPGSSDGDAGGLYAFLQSLKTGSTHGGPFLYRSAETDALGWVCERAAGERMARLLADLVWGPMGAEHDADVICDGVGTMVHDGGLSATARDLARFGQLLLDGGAVRSGATPLQVLPARWLRESWAVDSEARAAFVASPSEASFPGGWYRNQFWFRPGEQGDVLLCLGIHGQMVHVCRRTRTVCVKLSSWPTAQDPLLMRDTLRALDSVGAVLAGLERGGDRHGLAGVVAGLSRHGSRASGGHSSAI
jgi:CubicO group peptidase (beta-lactamase class C family)